MSTVLVVDDEPAIRELVVAMLEAEGYAARGARDGAQAVELVAEERPDLVLMDVMMPRLDGREALRRIRALRGCANLPVVLMSAALALPSGRDAADFLAKPFDLTQLLELVDSLLPKGPAQAATVAQGRPSPTGQGSP